MKAAMHTSTYPKLFAVNPTKMVVNISLLALLIACLIDPAMKFWGWLCGA